MKTPQSIYQEVKAIAEPVLKNYHNDLLVDDKNSIESNEELEKFLHFTGPLGTRYILLKNNAYLEDLEEIFEFLQRSGKIYYTLWLYFDGKKLWKINLSIAEWIVGQLIDKLLEEKQENLKFYLTY